METKLTILQKMLQTSKPKTKKVAKKRGRPKGSKNKVTTKVPTATSEARFTVGYTYFDEPHLLKKQIEIWKMWPKDIDIILVDDASRHSPAEDVIKEVDFKLEDYQPNFRLFKVTRNLGFNGHGCRNLIAKYALTDTIAFFDIDMFMYEGDIAYMKRIMFNKDKLYKHRLYMYQNQVSNDAPGHQNSFVINKDLYWEAGGYDESFTGWHWGDKEFLDRIEAIQEEKGLEQKWEDTTCTVTLIRNGRHGSVTTDESKTLGLPTHYVDDELFYSTLDCPTDVAKMVGSKKQVLDFPFIEVL